MNVLLDTHVALWAIADSPRLSDRARNLIQSNKTTVWVSTVSLWEISIKHGLGRGDMPISGKDAAQYFRASGYRMLPVEAEHSVAVEELPVLHHDPFDRLLIAQALVEPMRLITHDPALAGYSDTVITV